MASLPGAASTVLATSAQGGASAELVWVADYADVAVAIVQMMKVSDAVEEYERRFGVLPARLGDITLVPSGFKGARPVLRSVPGIPSQSHSLQGRSNKSYPEANGTVSGVSFVTSEEGGCHFQWIGGDILDLGGWGYTGAHPAGQDPYYVLFYSCTHPCLTYRGSTYTFSDIVAFGSTKKGGTWDICAGWADLQGGVAGSLFDALLNEVDVVDASIKAFHQANGKNPKMLADLVPTYLNAFSSAFTDHFSYDPVAGTIIPREP